MRVLRRPTANRPGAVDPAWRLALCRQRGLDGLTEWPERITTMQRNWIGRSEGLEFGFEVEGTHRAYAMRRVRHGGLQLAWSLLRPAFDKFPKEDIIPYNLACYAAQQGRLDAAWDWLQRAIEACGDAKVIKQRAMADTDLQPIWEKVRKL